MSDDITAMELLRGSGETQIRVTPGSRHPFEMSDLPPGALPSALWMIEEPSANDASIETRAALLDLDREIRESWGLSERLAQVIEQVRAASSSHMILSEIAVGGVNVFNSRPLEQLLTHLINNLIASGERSDTVMVTVRRADRELTMNVINVGGYFTSGPKRRSKAKRREIFRSAEAGFNFRGGRVSGSSLATCWQLARECGGELTALSDKRLTRFLFRVPIMLLVVSFSKP